MLRTWHFEDWLTALDQLVNDKPAPTFQNPPIEPGNYLTEVPQCISNFYEKILSDPSGGGQNEALIRETFHNDWNTRPNPLNPVQGTGPGPDGLKVLTGIWSIMFKNVKVRIILSFVRKKKTLRQIPFLHVLIEYVTNNFNFRGHTDSGQDKHASKHGH